MQYRLILFIKFKGGVRMDDTLLAVLLIGVAGLTMLVYRLGRRRIVRLAGVFSRELELGFTPEETEYTNIGGLIGYHALYRYTSPPVEKIQITFTFLPRHSLFFYPLSRLVLCHDRMFITLFAAAPFQGEGHLMERSLEHSPRHAVANAAQLHRSTLQYAGKEYLIFSADAGISDFLISIVKMFPEGMPRHLALYPGNSSFYIFLNPGKGGLAEPASGLLTQFRDYLIRGKA